MDFSRTRPSLPNFIHPPTRLHVLLIAAFLLPAANLRAADATVKTQPKPDVLVFANGDKLTGKLDHEAAGTVFFASDNAGTVQVPWAKLKSLHTELPFAVIEHGALVKRKSTNLSVPVGTLEINGDTLTVMTLQGAQEIPVKNIEYLVDKASFDKNVMHRQGLLQGITGSVTAGASTVNSTQNSESINTGVTLTRVVPAVAWMAAKKRTLLDFSNTYGRITEPNTPTVKTNILQGSIEEDEYFNPRFYLLEQAIFEHNYSQGLDLQQLYGVGFGLTALKNAKQELDLTAIMNYTKQQFASPIAVLPNQLPSTTQNLIGSTFGDNYTYKLPHNIVFTEIATFSPAWNVPQDYSSNVTAGATFPIIKNLGFSAQVIDSYLNDPAPGFLGNSLQFNTGLTYTIP